MTLPTVVATLLMLLDFGLKAYAIGTVPENRRPSSSTAWLLVILLLPLVGFPLYWLIGSPYVRGRRQEVQQLANRSIAARSASFPAPSGLSDLAIDLASVATLNQRLTGLPCVAGSAISLHDDPSETFGAFAEAVDGAKKWVYVEFYIMAWDEVTDRFFESLKAAAARGVAVRLLMDHLGSNPFPGWKQFQQRLTDAGIDWHLMMPLSLRRRQLRRPDLRNHRKFLVVDGLVGFIGSHNVIKPSYKTGRRDGTGQRLWQDLSVRVEGDVVAEISSVFATDWYMETHQHLPEPEIVALDADGHGHDVMQIVPSGPGFPTEPNLRMFTALINVADYKVSITSPYFVPDESLLAAITTAAYRGLEVELFVSGEADQFLVGHAQRSYYAALLQAGVRIYLYPAPAVLHSKYLTIDDNIAAIGSSNMDFRSFALDYELTLVSYGGDLVRMLQANDAEYRAVSRVLTHEEWKRQPWHQRYLDNVCRMAAALV